MAEPRSLSAVCLLGSWHYLRRRYELRTLILGLDRESTSTLVAAARLGPGPRTRTHRLLYYGYLGTVLPQENHSPEYSLHNNNKSSLISTTYLIIFLIRYT